MKFNPGQNKIVVRQGLSSTTYIKDTSTPQRLPQPELPQEETPIVKETKLTPKKKK